MNFYIFIILVFNRLASSPKRQSLMHFFCTFLNNDKYFPNLSIYWAFKLAQASIIDALFYKINVVLLTSLRAKVPFDKTWIWIILIITK